MQRTLSWYLRITSILSITVALTATTVYVYYLFWLAPAATTPQALMDIEAVTVKHYFSLLKHHLAVQELAGLNPASPDFYREREGAVAVLATSRDESLQTLEETLPQMENDFTQPLTALRRRHKDVLDGQKEATDAATQIEKITRELSAYQPEYDLAGLDPAAPDQQLFARLERANRAITALINEMNNISIHSTEIDQLTALLKLTVSELSKENADLSQTRDNFIKRINEEIKPAILAANLAPFKNDELLALMTEETNIIDDYRYLLDSIDAKQAEMYHASK